MDIFENLKNKKIPVILKWPNGRCKKSKDIIRSSFPKNLTKCQRYVEPFVGGASVLITFLLYHMEASGFPETSKIYASDINPYVINFHNTVKNHPGDLYEGIIKTFDEFFEQEGHDAKKAFYKRKCDEFNLPGSTGVQNATLLFFLNHTCFKGLYRTSRKGLFNSPYGFSSSDSSDNEKIKKVLNLKSFKKKILNLSELFQRVEFFCQDNLIISEKEGERKNILIDQVSYETDLVFIDFPERGKFIDLINKKSLYIIYENDGNISYVNKENSSFNFNDLYLRNFSECSISSSIYNSLMEATIKKKDPKETKIKNSDLVNEIISDDILKRRKKWAEMKNKQRKRDLEKYGEIKKYPKKKDEVRPSEDKDVKDETIPLEDKEVKDETIPLEDKEPENDLENLLPNPL